MPYSNEQQALQALQDVYAFFSGTNAVPVPPSPASNPPQTYVGTIKFIAKGNPMFGGWPVTLAMQTDDNKALNFSLSDVSSVSQLLGLSAAQASAAQAALTSLESEWSNYVASLAAGNPLPTPHVSVVVAPPVQQGGYWFLLSYADI